VEVVEDFKVEELVAFVEPATIVRLLAVKSAIILDRS
jgi:hypothetical protein